MKTRQKKLSIVLVELALVFALTGTYALVFGENASTPTTSGANEIVLAPGVSYRAFDVPTPKGVVKAHLITADLRQPEISVDLLYPGVVAKALPLKEMADAQGAIAGVNADFFNISVTQPGIVATNAAVGPAIAAGEQLKAAVPTKQRFGPSLPYGVTVEDVIGIGTDRVMRMGRLTLQGSIVTPYGTYPVNGFNQYAIAQGGIGVFNQRWGTVSRKRAICGTDNKREDACSSNIYEVTVENGRVVAVSPQPGAGSIANGSIVLVGREIGADRLRQLQIGDAVSVSYSLASSEQVPFTFAVGGQPILRNGKPLPGLDSTTLAVRTGAGFSADGRTLYLVSINRSTPWLSYASLASVLLSVGADSGINLDGGGSSTLVIREPGKSEVSLMNLAPGEEQRPIPFGIGIFVGK